MRKIFTALVAALTVGSALAASAPAEARRDRWDYRGDHRGWDHYRGDRYRGDRDYGGYRGDRYYRGGRGYYGSRDYYYAPRYGYGYGYDYPRHRYYRDNDGALIAGIAGLAIGAAIASSDGY